MKTKLEELKEKQEAPNWMTNESYSTLSKGYLLKGETPKGMYKRVSSGVADRLSKPELADKFFDLMWKNWLCLATPVASNTNTKRALPISCFSLYIPDSMIGISDSMTELAIMSKYGGGVGVHWNGVRPKGSPIGPDGDGGNSDGVIPFMKMQDSTTIAVSQGATRRGASAAYLPVEHLDVEEFLRVRRPEGDVNRQCLNIHQGVCITDEWMNSMLSGDKKKRELWREILKSRVETGEPYLFFTDNVNNQNPDAYKKNNLTVKGSNICCLSEDTLVVTSDGPQKIVDLVGKSVNIWDGNQWVNNSSFEQRGVDSLYQIDIVDGSHTKSNANHRWFVARSYHNIRKNKYTETLTSDLKVGDWIQSHSVEYHGTKSENAAYLKGFLVGDGTHIEDRPLLRLHSEKYVCENQLIQSANELPIEAINTNAISVIGFGKEIISNDTASYGKQEVKNLQGLSTRKTSLIKWVTSHREELPNEVFEWNKDSKLKLLAGLFDSDGTISENNNLQFSAKSEKLIKSIQLLLKTFGYSSNIDFSNSNEMFRITVSSYDTWLLLSQTTTSRIKLSSKKPNRKLTGWRRITNITKLEGQVPVYCPILPTTGKFALANGLMTGNTEIMLHTDDDHSFVCCLSSMNLARFDEWKNTNAVYLATWFLDGVMQEFIDKAKLIKGFERAVRSAEKGRALGVGALGFHTLLQKKLIPLDSLDAFQLNSEIFRHLDKETKKATKDLAKEYGEPEWCQGLGIRNTHRIAIAPTVSNSIISGDVSQGIEPWASNYFARITAKGTFYNKNKQLEEILEARGQNSDEVWKSINSHKGSVQHLDFLSDLEKEVFLTAREINQFVIIKLAAQRQKFIDQGQSINIFFPSNADGKYIHQVHIEAWKQGIKSLYYFRSESVLSGESASREHERIDILNGTKQNKETKQLYTRSLEECKACEG